MPVLAVLAMGLVSSPAMIARTLAGKITRPDSASFPIVASDRGFDAPTRLSAGLRHIVFTNRGTQVHEAMLVKLPAGMSPGAYVAAIKNGAMFPTGALDYSGPGLTEPGETVEVWIKVDPGRYVLICWNGDHPTTVPVHAFTVTADGVADASAPKVDAVLRQLDFHYELVGKLHVGMQVIRIETPGPSMHEMDLFRLRGDYTVSDLNQWRKREDAGLPPGKVIPADAMGGVLDRHDIHRVAWLRRNFKPGRYVFFCEMPMPGHAGLTHADVGMEKEILITPGR